MVMDDVMFKAGGIRFDRKHKILDLLERQCGKRVKERSCASYFFCKPNVELESVSGSLDFDRS